MAWTLADIRRKVRQVTGRLSSNQISNTRLDEYINNYYQYTLPAELKLERQHTYYEFNTVINQQEYSYPTTFTNFEPPVYLDFDPLLFYQDPAVYFSETPEQITASYPWTGDGAIVVFATTVSVPEILPGTVIVNDNVETFTDNGSGILTGNQGGNGTVNYSTGAISVTFNTAPANGQTIRLSFEQYQPGRPQSVLLYDNVFRFFPIPDSIYRIRVKAYSIPTALTAAGDVPVLEEWGPTISYGAARDLCADYGETERYAEITALYKEQVSYTLTRTMQSLLNERARPMW